MLLILALRRGEVPEASISEVLANAGARKDRTVKWSHPDHPIICSIKNGSTLDAKLGALGGQLTRTLADAALLAGALDFIRTHDVRRGAAGDLAYLRDPVIDVASASVASAIGHTNRSHFAGVTAEYVGERVRDLWAPRINTEFQDPFGVDFAEDKSMPIKRSKFSREQVDIIVEEYHMKHPDVALTRNSIVKKHHQDNAEAWRQQQKESLGQ